MLALRRLAATARRAHPLRRLTTESKSSRHLLLDATARQLKGDIPRAEELARAALGALDADDVAVHVDCWVFLGKLSQLQGKFDDAEGLFIKARSAQSEEESYHSTSLLAHTLRMQGRDDEAIKEYRAALDGLAATKGWTDGATNHAAAALASLLGERGSFAAAEAIQSRAEAGLDTAFGSTDPRTLVTRVERARLAGRDGRKDDARALLASAMADLDPRHPAYRTAMAAEAKLDD